MTQTYQTILTHHGERLIVDALANKLPVPLKTMAIGDGNGAETIPKAAQTALVREVYRAEITDLLQDTKNRHQVIAELLIPEHIGGFMVREIGLFDDQGALVAVANCPENYKPVLEQGSGKVQYYRIVLQVSSSDAVTLTLNNNIVHTTRAEFEQFVESLEAPDGFRHIGRCKSVAELRKMRPTEHGQRILVDAYYEGGTTGGGEFVADLQDMITPDDGGVCFVVERNGGRWKRLDCINISPMHFGAKADGVSDDTQAIQALVTYLKPYSTLNFGGHNYKFNLIDCAKPITITGSGELITDGFNIKTSDFKSLFTGKMTALRYPQSRGFVCTPSQDGNSVGYKNITIKNTTFEGFFYATAMLARPYSDSQSGIISSIENVLIQGCTSTAPDGKNAGHFQHIGCNNVRCIGNATYGGKNATSYNFINNNGQIVVANNYETGNDYGACEIENASGKVVIIGNTFDRQVWIDDSKDIIVSSNIIKNRIFVTSQTHDVDNILILGNIASNISVTKFGENPITTIKKVEIKNNILSGNNINHGVFIDLNVEKSIIDCNDFSNGQYTNAVAIAKKQKSSHFIRFNSANNAKSIISGSSDSEVIEYGNIGFAVNSNSPHLSHLMQNNEDFVDLPACEMHASQVSGGLLNGGTHTFIIDVKKLMSPSARVLEFTLGIKNETTYQYSSFSIKAVYQEYNEIVKFNMSERYAVCGNVPELTIDTSGTTGTQIVLNVRNQSNNVIQATLLPKISTGFGLRGR